MTEGSFVELVGMLRKAGYEDPEVLLEQRVIPFAKQKGITLYQALNDYANPAEDQDTSEFQLHMALLQIDGARLLKIEGIEIPFKKPRISKRILVG